jgi:hypothetical protein
LGGITCPRISPPGLACVCTLTYHSPAVNCCACSGVSVALPLIGLGTGAPFSLNQITGGAFLPSDAGPWKCAIVAGPESPLEVTLHISIRVAWSKVRSAVPVAVVCTGGTCGAPVSATLKESGAACDDAAQTAMPARLAATIHRDARLKFSWSSPWIVFLGFDLEAIRRSAMGVRTGRRASNVAKALLFQLYFKWKEEQFHFADVSVSWTTPL